MKTFKLTKNHLKLIQNFNIVFNEHSEFGAPMVNPKRPYGNSDAYDDIAQILNIKAKPEDNQAFSDNQYDYMDKIHQETAIALQIILSTKSFKIGVYELNSNENWILHQK